MKAKMKTLNKEKQLLFKSRKIRKERLREKGITLIALVVTIIILLILVGVTLNIALSENGLFDKAKQSAERAKDVTEEEQVKVAVTDALVAGAGTLSTDNVKEGLKSVFGEEKVNDSTFSGTGPWTFVGERKSYTIDGMGEIEGKVTKGKVTEVFPRVDYDGTTYVNYGFDIDGDGDTTEDWRVCYNDGKNVFIIAADYIKNKYIQLGSNIVNKTGTAGMQWMITIDNQFDNIDKEVFDIYKCNSVLSKRSEDEYAKRAYTLLNTHNWENFVIDGFGLDAIGGMTVEMWVESWNAHSDKNNYPNIELITGDSGTLLFKFKDDGEVDSSCWLGKYSGYNNKLYFPVQSDGDHWYVLSDYNENGNTVIEEGGSINHYKIYYDPEEQEDGWTTKVRPVVRLNPELIATLNEDGTLYELSKDV